MTRRWPVSKAVGDSHMVGGARPAPFIGFSHRHPMAPPRINKERIYLLARSP
jgi:hypothetical protein